MCLRKNTVCVLAANSVSFHQGEHGRATWLSMDAMLRELRSLYHSLLTRLSSLFRVSSAAQSHLFETCQVVWRLALLNQGKTSGSMHLSVVPACSACV